jgi:uncharacterized membrane protein
MNTSQIHLALTHLPVILSLAGMVMLVISLIRKIPVVTKVSYYMLMAAGLAALPVFLSGGGAEETVEHLPGVSEGIIEQHESLARFALAAVLASALVAFFGLIKFSYRPVWKAAQFLTLFFALASTVLMAQTAHLGGQIRHTEIRSASLNTNNPGDTETSENGNEQKDDDD